VIRTDAFTRRSARDAWIRALVCSESVELDPLLTLPILVEGLAEQYTSKPALVALDDSLSYAELALRCRRYARWGIAQGLKDGDVVVLFMSNCAGYLAVWLGLTRIGVTVALVNNQLSGARLLGDWSEHR
jgi:fatty-acyl-CoA synthase